MVPIVESFCANLRSMTLTYGQIGGFHPTMSHP